MSEHGRNFFVPMKRLLPIAASAILALSFASCNTVAGVGQDISKGGRALANAAS